MPPNEELQSVRSDVRGLREDLRECVRDINASVKDLVTEKLCTAKHQTADAKIVALSNTVESNHNAVIGAIGSLRAEVGGLVNGKLEEHSREVVSKVVKDRAFRDEIAEVTSRHDVRKLRPTGPLSRVGDSARNITAIIALVIMLLGGCVTAAYYVVGISTTLEHTMLQQRALLRSQSVPYPGESAAARHAPKPVKSTTLYHFDAGVSW